MGLVIDPRNMDCGLFHWSEYPADPNTPAEALAESLGERQLFSLLPADSSTERAADTPSRSVLSPGRRSEADEPGPFSQARFCFALVLCLVAVLSVVGATWPDPYAARWARVPLDPLPLTLTIALSLLVLLRLWNAGTFHPDPDGPDLLERWSDPDFRTLWWRFLALVPALGLLFFWGVGTGPRAAGTIPVVIFLVLLVLVIVEFRFAGLFTGTPRPELAILGMAAAAGRFAGGIFRAAGKTVWPVVRPMLRWAPGIIFTGWLGIGLLGLYADVFESDPFVWGGLVMVPAVGLLLFVYARLEAYRERRDLTRPLTPHIQEVPRHGPHSPHQPSHQ
jgi:hypothetical protein